MSVSTMSERIPDKRDQTLEVLKQLPPLMPVFLRKRRAVIPEIQALIHELMGTLGLDRSTLFALIGLHELQGGYDWQPITESQIRVRDPYSTIDRMASPVAILKNKGLLSPAGEGRLSLSPKARAAINEMHERAREYVGMLQPLPAPELARLARQLERARDTVLRDPLLAPRPGSHLAGSRSLATFGEDAPTTVRLEQAVLDLWMARDDAHIRAWQDAGLDGPTDQVLTTLWQGEHRTVPALKEALKGSHTPESVDACLAYLADSDYVVRRDDEAVQLTPKGVLVRQDIERETDRIYFNSWPYNHEEALGVCSTLKGLLDNL